MKIRSRALYAYLLEADVLTKTPAEIDCVKREYRRLYKKQWRKNKRPQKEIRIDLTLKQFQAVKLKARGYALRHTTYARQVILATVESDGKIIPNRETLEKVLQLVSMAAIASERSAVYLQLSAQLAEAEQLLLDYLSE